MAWSVEPRERLLGWSVGDTAYLGESPCRIDTLRIVSDTHYHATISIDGYQTLVDVNRLSRQPNAWPRMKSEIAQRERDEAATKVVQFALF